MGSAGIRRLEYMNERQLTSCFTTFSGGLLLMVAFRLSRSGEISEQAQQHTQAWRGESPGKPYFLP